MIRRLARVASLVVIVGAVGCVPITGVPSMTLMTRDLGPDSPNLELVGGPIEETETWTWALLFLVWGERPTHESVVAAALEKHDADVLLNGELTTTQYGIPYLFMQFKTTARGQPARFQDGGAP